MASDMQSRQHQSLLVGPWSVLVLPKSIPLSDQNLYSGIASSTQDLLALSAHESRRQELLRSRWLLRIGYGLSDPDRGSEGEPVWPANICGSLSHKDGHVVALSVTRDKLRSIGLDIEKFQVSERVSQRVLTASECTLLSELGCIQQLGAAGFAAKEAIFKAVFPVGRQRFWFEDATVIAIQRSPVDEQCYRMTASVGERAGGPKSWDRLCHVDLKLVTLDGGSYWLAVCGIPDTAFNLKF